MAVHAGQVDVEDDESGTFLGEKASRLEAVEGLMDGEVDELAHEPALEEVVELGVVVDDEDRVPVDVFLEIYLESGRYPHPARIEEADEVLGVDPILTARSGESLEIAVADPVDGCLIDHAAEVGDFERGKAPG